MKIFVLDNYDSFTYNLVEAIRIITGNEITVRRNDKFDMREIEDYDKIILSPGPGIPDEAGMLKQLIETFKARKSILGICLGMQAIGEVCGAKLVNLPKVFHGISSPVKILDREEIIFKGMSEVVECGRYHSWAIDPETIPKELRLTAVDYEGIPMAISHEIYDLKGLQFHPESIMTREGNNMLTNWLRDRQQLSFPSRGNSKFDHGSISESKLFF
jgi:anthranilate synthase component II